MCQATGTWYCIVVAFGLFPSIRRFVSRLRRDVLHRHHFLVRTRAGVDGFDQKGKGTAVVDGGPPSDCQTRNAPIICGRVRAVVIGAMISTCSQVWEMGRTALLLLLCRRSPQPMWSLVGVMTTMTTIHLSGQVSSSGKRRRFGAASTECYIVQ
jgi:hypothetical protein